MSESVFLPIHVPIKKDDKLKVTVDDKDDNVDLKVTVGDKELTVLITAITYEKVPASEFKEKSPHEENGQELYYDKNGNELKTKPNDSEEIFRRRMLRNRANINDIIKNFVGNKYFVKKSTEPDGYLSDYYGGRKRKQSKYSSKKRSVKSHRLRNSRKRRYSRRR
jgi:hypothetical protein